MNIQQTYFHLCVKIQRWLGNILLYLSPQVAVYESDGSRLSRKYGRTLTIDIVTDMDDGPASVSKPYVKVISDYSIVSRTITPERGATRITVRVSFMHYMYRNWPIGVRILECYVTRSVFESEPESAFDDHPPPLLPSSQVI